MAKGYTVKTSVFFDGKQAQRELDKLQLAADVLEKEMSKLKETLGDDYKASKDFQKLNAQWRSLTTAIIQGEEQIQGYTDVLNNLSGQSVRSLTYAVRAANAALRSFKGDTAENREEIVATSLSIDQAKFRITQLKAGFSDLMGQAQDTTGMTVSQMEKLKKLLIEEQSLVANDSKVWDEYERVIQRVGNSIDYVKNSGKNFKEEAALDVVANLDVASTNEINKAISDLKEIRNELVVGSEEWQEMGISINTAEEYLKSYTTSGMADKMNSQFENLTSLSASALNEQKKYWQGMVDGAAAGSQELANYESKLADVIAQEQSRIAAQAGKVMASPESFSVKEIQEAIKATEQLRDAQQPGSDAWKNYASQVENANNVLARFKDEAKLDAMNSQFESLASLSASALNEQKKYWQGVVDNAKPYSTELDNAKSKLEAISKLETNRKQGEALKTLAIVESGAFDGTIEETQQAIKLLQEYQANLKTSDTAGIERVNTAIETLNVSLGKVKESAMSVDEAMNIGTQLQEGTFRGTLQELEKANKTLMELKANTSVSDTEGLQKINTALREIQQATNKAKAEVIDVGDLINNRLKTASLDELQRAAKQLQEQISHAERNTEEYVRASAQLRTVRAELDEAKDGWEENGNAIADAAKNLKAYILAYFGISEGLEKLKQIFSANLELSDSLAAVQKTTGLTAKEVGSLSSEIDKIDTRASQEQLHQLAATAGQMGVTAQEDILGFVRAANQLTVALDELGEDGVESLVKINQLTGETDKLGLERALLASGSAINELSASSAASAGPIADVISRLGGIGSAANLGTADLAALGATADALGQSTEVAGSSLGKFIGTLVSKSDQVADAVGLDRQYLQGLIDQGNTMEAMIAVFERMENMGGFAKLAPIMGDLGSEGARASALFAAFAGNVDLLKSQVDVSRTAFTEATSVTREYNTVNETAAALVQRMGNSIREFFVNSGVVEWITNLLRAVMDLPGWLDRNVFAINGVTASVTALTAALTANHVRMLLVAKGVKSLSDAWLLLRLAAIQAQTAMIGALRVLTRHPILLAATAATAALGFLVGAIVKASKSTKELSEQQKTLNESTKSYDAQVLKEQRSLNDLYGALNRAKQGTETRRKLIGQINSQYGKYLDNMLTEKSTADEIRKSYDKINESLRANIALKAQNETIDKIQAQGVEEQATQLQNLRDSFGEYTDNSGLIETVIGQVVQRVDSAQQQGISNIKVLYDVQRELLGSIVGGGREVSEEMAEALDAYIRSVYGTAVAIQNTKKKYAPIIGSNPSGTGTTTTTEESGGTGGSTVTPLSEEEKKRIAKEKERAAVSGYKDSLKLMDAYYKDREALVRKRIMEEGKSEADLNIELNRLNDERLRDTEQFQKRMLGMENTFDPSKFKVTVDGKEEVYFSEKDMQKLEQNIKTYGSKMTAGIRQELTNTQVEIQSRTWGIKQEMMKVLLDNDDIARVTNDFQQALTTTGLFSSDIENLDKQQADKRLSLLKEWSKDSQNMTLQDIKNKVMLEESFDEWREGRTDEHFQTLLMMLRNYGQEVNDIERQQQEDRQKMIEEEWVKSGKEDQWQKRDTENQRNVDLTGNAMDIGLASQEQLDDAQIKLYQDRLLAAQDYYNYVMQYGGDVMEAERARNEAYLALDQAEMESQKHKMETMQGYADALTGFAEQMGEAAWGEVDDRKEAAKQLLQTTMNLTKQLILEKVKELISKKALAQQEVVMTQTTEQTKTAIQGQSAITDLTVEQAKTQAEMTMGISQGGSKTIGKLGWWGIPLIAVITAALNALMSAAMSSVNKAKSEVASATGVGGGKKLSTGMLTYAEGNYPVLGNDGKVYDAKYEGSNLKTGVYKGGAHFGIFSEKLPEMIVDGKTTQKLILNYPHIYDAITTIAKHGRLVNAMPTFAAGDYPAGLTRLTNTDTSAMAMVDEEAIAREERTNAVLEQASTAIRELSKVLTSGQISASVDPYANSKATKRAERFMRRRNIG